MSIIAEDDRSSKRRWYAKRTIEKAKMLGLPHLTSSIDGFLVMASIGEDGQEKAFVKTVEGIAVLCTREEAVELFVTETMGSPFIGPIPMYMLHQQNSGALPIQFLLFNKVPDPDPPDYLTIPMRQDPWVTYRVINNDPPPGYTTTFPAGPSYPDSWPYPTIDCAGGEQLVINYSMAAFIDLNENGIHDYPAMISETLASGYIENGSRVNARFSIHLEGGDAGGDPWRVYMRLPYNSGIRQVFIQSSWYELYGDDLYAAVLMTLTDAPAVNFILLEDVVDGTSPPPAGLVAALLDWQTDGLQVFPIGSYAFALAGDAEPTVLQVIDLTCTYPGCPDGSVNDYFDANPGDIGWKIFYSMHTPGGSTYTISSDQFLTTLDSLANGDIIGGPGPDPDWELARRMIEQFTVWPGNNNWEAPFDSVMFHGADGNVYVWTREYGAVKFTPTGLFTTTLYLPTEVTGNDGIRAEISYAGDGVYLCVCNDLNTPQNIPAVYYGTPFIDASWTSLSALDAEYTILHVRPINVTETDQLIMAIIKDTTDNCFFSMYVGRTSGDPPIYSSEWKMFGQIPVTFEEGMNWSTTLYGKAQNQYLSPPHVLPQMPVGPYSSYADGMP